MLPWLIGAAAVAIAGAVLNDSDSSSSSRSYDDGDAQRKRLKEEKEAKINIAKNNFKSKWGLSYFQASEEEWTPKKIKTLYTKQKTISKDIENLNKLLSNI